MNLATEAQDRINELLFSFRKEVSSKFRLRQKPPSPVIHPGELAFYELLLQSGIPPELSSRVSHCIDIGCKNWSYLPALLKHFPAAALTGVEVDPYRRYGNLYLRGDYARAQVKAAEAQGRIAEFIPGDFCEISSKARETKGITLFCLFYPFLSKNPCLKWGLPLRFSNYESLLEKILSQTSPRAFLFSVHQGEWEGEIAEEHYLKRNLAMTRFVLPTSKFSTYWPSLYPPVIFFGSIPSKPTA